MSILIKGMVMPKNCDECRIMQYEDTNCISVHELYCGCPIVFMAHPQHEEHRPNYCPLIELPPHGRLIDADAAAKQGWTISRTYSASPNEQVYEVKTMDDEVLPTIIPADESDMDSFIRIFEGDDEEDGMDSFIRILKD